MNLEERVKRIMAEIKSQFGNAFEPPNEISPELIEALIISLTLKFREAFLRTAETQDPWL